MRNFFIYPLQFNNLTSDCSLSDANTFPSELFKLWRKKPWDETGPGESTAKSRKDGAGQLTATSMEHSINSLMFIIRKILYSIPTNAAPGLPGHVQLGWTSNWGAGLTDPLLPDPTGALAS